MESKAVSEVKGVTLTMDLREAIAFLEDPERAQEHVRGQLRGHGLLDGLAEAPSGGNRTGKPHRAKGGGNLKCNRCGKEGLTPMGFKLHVARMHPETLRG